MRGERGQGEETYVDERLKGKNREDVSIKVWVKKIENERRQGRKWLKNETRGKEVKRKGRKSKKEKRRSGIVRQTGNQGKGTDEQRDKRKRMILY